MTTNQKRDEQEPLHAHDYEIKKTTLSHIRVFRHKLPKIV